MRPVSAANDGEVLAVVGETARGSRDRRRGRSALHVVSAWGCRNRQVPCQAPTAEKSKLAPADAGADTTFSSAQPHRCGTARQQEACQDRGSLRLSHAKTLYSGHKSAI